MARPISLTYTYLFALLFAKVGESRYMRNVEKKNPYQSLQFLNEKDPGDDKMQQRITHRVGWKHQYNDFVVKEASFTATITRNCAFPCKLTEN